LSGTIIEFPVPFAVLFGDANDAAYTKTGLGPCVDPLIQGIGPIVNRLSPGLS